MRALALALLISPAAAQDSGEAQALARVQAAERAMNDARRAADTAQRGKNDAAKRAMDAVQRHASLPDWRIISRAIAEGKAKDAKAAFRAAREEAAKAESGYVDSGKEYLDAENAYRRGTGHFYNEQQYDAVQSHVRAAGQASEAPVEADKAAEEAQSVQKLLQAGKPAGFGELAAAGQNLSRMGDDLVAQTVEGKWGGGGSRAPASDPSGWTASAGAPGAPGGAGYGRAGPSPDALDPDKAILLSRPTARYRSSIAGRFASAAAEQLAANDPKAALRAAEEAIKADPRSAKAWTAKAEALNRQRRFGEAEEAARRAAQLDRGDVRAWRELAWAQLHNGKGAEAADSATRMIFLDPESAEGYLLRAFAYEIQGDRGRMLADLERAAALDGRFANHLARARAGLRLFDPGADDNERLLDGLEPPPASPGRNPLVKLGFLLFLLAGLSGAARGLPVLAARWRARRAAARPAPARPKRPAPAESALGGKYRLVRVAGRGGMGQVWEAVDTSLERPVAVKEAAPELAGEPALRELYLKEARTIATLRHPNIVEIYEILDLPPRLYLVFEWVSGKTLAQILAEKRRLDLAAARAVLGPVCEALASAHERGVVHRDLKPANVMVTSDGHVKLMDFGIARAIDSGARIHPGTQGTHPGTQETALTAADGRMNRPSAASEALGAARTRTVAGTPAYRPPDAVDGVITPAFDVFCLGVCLYETLSGELPFGPAGWSAGRTAEPLSRRVPGLPEALDDLLARALDPDPARRLKDVRAFKAALSRL